MDENIEFRLKTLEEDSRRNQETHKEFFHRLEAIGAEQARTDEHYITIMATLAKLEAAIEELKSKPAKRWDSIMEKVIWAVLAALIAFVLAQIGIA